MGVVADALKLTYEHYLELPEDGKRHELVDGEHLTTPSPSRRHQAISANLLGALWTFLKRHGGGEVLSAPFDVVLSEVDVVQPDLVFVSRDRQSILTDRNVEGAPDLVVEIVSEATRRRDELVKRRLYARFGVREYWVVDPELETVRVLRLGEQGYQEVGILSRDASDSLTTDLLPGLAIPLADVFP